MSNEALRKAVESAGHYLSIERSGNVEFVRLNKSDWDTIEQALHDQEAEIARLQSDCDLRFQQAMTNGQAAQQAEAALATRRANYDALVLRLGEVTALAESRLGLLREMSCCAQSAIKAGDWKVDGACDPDATLTRITTHLKAADHV